MILIIELGTDVGEVVLRGAEGRAWDGLVLSGVEERGLARRLVGIHFEIDDLQCWICLLESQ